MSYIRIFIASSFDTAHERAVVGDAVRMLNDRYEGQGWRIKLHCWEDYEPEYRGIRKQSEYNEDLIKTSDIFIALFRENCGDFTQEEINVWKDILQRVPVVFDIYDAVVDKSKVQNYLNAQGLTPITVASDDEIYMQVETIVSHFIATHPATATGTPVIIAKEIYATIPDDRYSERAPFGNLVRSVDDFAERTFHCRCRLTKGDVTRISGSDYYAAILKDCVNALEETEILTAIYSRKTTQRPDVELYYNHGDNICLNHPRIKTAINSCGIFNEPFDTFHRIKFNLVRWLHQQSILAVELNAGVDIQDGWFIFFKMPVIPLSVLGINGGTVVQQRSELFRLFSFAVLGVNTQVTSSSGEVDLDALDSQMSRTNTVSEALQNVEQEIRNRREEWLQKVSDNIDALLSGRIDASNIGRLAALIDRKEQLQLSLSVEPRELLRTQMLMVQVSDTYPMPFSTLGRDADAQYLKVAQTADRYGVKDPTVEMMRMNYANYLHRQNRNTEALTFYETAMAHINEFDDRSELMRRYIMHLYVTYINFVSSLGENQRAFDAINKLTQKETAWEKQGLTEVETIANHCQILACRLRIRPLEGKVFDLLNQAMHTYKSACAIPHEEFDLSIRMDVFCDLPNCIAATTIDARTYYGMPDDKLKSNVDYFLGNVVDYAEKHRDEPNSMFYLSEALHNWAFFYSNQEGEQAKARKICEKALAVRRHLYAVTKQPATLYEVAQTLLLLGAPYVNDLQETMNEADFQAAMRYAEECLSLYESLNQEHYLEQDTRVYEAIQLKGSILYYGGRKEEGLTLLKKAWDWNLSHPDNNYVARFRGVSGEILKKEGII